MAIWVIAGLLWWLVGWKAAACVLGVALAAEIIWRAVRIVRKGDAHAS